MQRSATTVLIAHSNAAAQKTIPARPFVIIALPVEIREPAARYDMAFCLWESNAIRKSSAECLNGDESKPFNRASIFSR